MCQLPRTQPKSAALAGQMIDGFTKYPDTFPSADIGQLQDSLTTFREASHSFSEAAAAYKNAGKQQKQAFEQLKVEIANQIKVAQADTAASPAKLAFIGYGRRKKKRAVPLPAQVQLLPAEPLAAGIVKLRWQKTHKSNCGATANFRIESRIVNDQRRNSWRLVDTSFDCEKVLDKQPTNVRIEYRIFAANRTGHSLSSNIVTAIL